MSHPHDIPMPDYDHAHALFQAELTGGDTDHDSEMSEASPPPPHSPPRPLYNNNPPHSFDIAPSHTIDLTNELTRPGGPLPISGPFFDVDIAKTLKLMLEAYQQGPTILQIEVCHQLFEPRFLPCMQIPRLHFKMQNRGPRAQKIDLEEAPAWR
jgi:hypothetical protein